MLSTEQKIINLELECKSALSKIGDSRPVSRGFNNDYPNYFNPNYNR